MPPRGVNQCRRARFDALRAAGVASIIFDKDNTLTAPLVDTPILTWRFDDARQGRLETDGVVRRAARARATTPEYTAVLQTALGFGRSHPATEAPNVWKVSSPPCKLGPYCSRRRHRPLLIFCLQTK